MFDLITIGDPTLDTFIIIDEEAAKLQCNLKHEECLLCLNYADKIPFEKTGQSVGGNAANLAVGCKKLGLKTALVAEIGDDINGQIIEEELETAKVNTDYLETIKDKQTRYSIVLNYKSERTILSYHSKHNYKLNKLPASKWIYYTSLGEGFEKIQNKLVKHLNKNPQTKIIFNPGSYQIKHGLTEIKKLFPRTDLLFVNKEEAQKITKTKKTIPELFKILYKTGIKKIVITDGRNGSYAYDGKKIFFMRPYPIKPIARTGAGDAYASGFLSALFFGYDLSTALKWGSANGAAVTQKIGAEKGLLNQTGIKKILTRYPRIQPQIL